MKIRVANKKLAILLCCAVTAVTVSGCQYSNFDEYLEMLGLKDPYQNENVTSDESTFIISEDSLTATDGYTSIYQNDNSSEKISLDGESVSTDVYPSAEGEFEEYESVSETVDIEGADNVYAGSYKNLTEDELNSEMKEAREAAGLTDSNIALLKSQQEGLYAYERLTNSGKNLYVEILAIIQNMAENVLVSTTSDEAIDLVFDYVMADHPELFYVDGYKYTNYTLGDVITKIGFSGAYTMTSQEVENNQQLINQAVSECLAGAPSSEDEYYAIKYIYEYLIKNTEYDMNAENNQNICSVFIGGKSVCNGYSKAAQYLLNKLGINCTLVTGTVNTKKATGVRHAWNLVKCNDAYYYFDVTWGDSSYQTNNGESADATRLPEVNYDYLNVTTDEISSNHIISDEIDMPVCNSLKDNYYVREDEYFTSSELPLIGELFERRYRDGSANVVIKCATDDIYNVFFEQLITQRKVFDYLQGDTSTVSYTTFADTNTIIFWL